MFLNYLSSLPPALVLGLIWGIMALGVYITYKVLDIPDLTVDGSFATGGIVAAVIIANGGHFVLAMLAGFGAGLVCGLVTGLLHTFLGVPPILAGILTQIACYSINLKISSNKSNVSIPSRTTETFFAMSNVYDALWKAAIVVVIIAIVLYIFFGTELGASIRATGNNKDMSKAQGINTKFNIVLGLVISNGLVAFAGTLLAQYQGFADITMGTGAIVTGLCAVVIGLALFSKISPNFLVRMSGVVVGSLIYYFIFQTAVFFIQDTILLKLLAALIVAIFLGVPYLKKKYGQKIKKHYSNKKLMAGGNNHD